MNYEKIQTIYLHNQILSSTGLASSFCVDDFISAMLNFFDILIETMIGRNGLFAYRIILMNR